MEYSLLLRLLDLTRLSPEAFAARIGLSGMTLRRWKESPPKGVVPKIYEKAVVEVVPQFVHEGLLQPDAKEVEVILENAGLDNFRSVITNMGISPEFFKTSAKAPLQNHTENIIHGLSQIGADEQKKKVVEQSAKKMNAFKKMGPEWMFRIRTLVKILKSKKLYVSEKLPAYGALFYLLNPFDLIPDYLQIFGFVDDFCILGIVVAYYLKRYRHLSE